MVNYQNIVNQIASFKEEIMLPAGAKPKDVLLECFRMKPALLYYINSVSFSSSLAGGRIVLEYKNLNIPVEDICSPLEKDLEPLIREKVSKFEKYIIMVVPARYDYRRILNTFMEKMISFYPNLKSYQLSWVKYDTMGLPYVAYDLRLTYRIGSVMLKQMEMDVDKKVQELVKSLFPISMPDSAKCFIAHNYLATTIDYWDEDHGSPLERGYVQSAYGALLRGQCVCQGYAEAYKRILDAVGISCDLVPGKILEDGELHAWNIVRLNGRAAHVDVTWDSHKRKASTVHFCKADSFYLDNREWNRFYMGCCAGNDWILKEATYFCKKNRDVLLRMGLKKEWIE